MADERYTLSDVENLAAHLRPTIDRQIGEVANLLSPTQLADAALTWVADHGWSQGACKHRGGPAQHAVPPLAGFVQRVGILVSDLDDTGPEAAIALGHWPEADVTAAFAEHAHLQWGDDTKRPTGIRRGWVVNAGTNEEWCLVPSAGDVTAAFRVTYWEY